MLDSTGSAFGIGVEAYADGVGNQPMWLAVSTGRRAPVIVFVPVEGSSMLFDDVVISDDLDRPERSPAERARAGGGGSRRPGRVSWPD